MVDAFTGLRNEASRLSLIINETKTEPLSGGNIAGQQFDIVDEFVYLGALIRADNDSTLEIKKRINRC